MDDLINTKPISALTVECNSGENYWETYYPVVSMLSVRLLLAITQIHGLETK